MHVLLYWIVLRKAVGMLVRKTHHFVCKHPGVAPAATFVIKMILFIKTDTYRLERRLNS